MKIRNMVLSALFAALLAVCAWISLPLGAIHFTLQTFGIFLALLILGGKWGCVSILVYIALGAMGLPVFSSFQGGIGVLLGPTGGCIFGFMLTALLYWLATALLGQKPLIQISALILGLLSCYLVGWLWYCRFAPMNFFLWCLPYLLPDGGKLILAWFISRRLNRTLQK